MLFIGVYVCAHMSHPVSRCVCALCVLGYYGVDDLQQVLVDYVCVCVCLVTNQASRYSETRQNFTVAAEFACIIHKRAYVCIQMYVCIPTYSHTHIQTCTHTHTHTRRCRQSLPEFPCCRRNVCLCSYFALHIFLRRLQSRCVVCFI